MCHFPLGKCHIFEGFANMPDIQLCDIEGNRLSLSLSGDERRAFK